MCISKESLSPLGYTIYAIIGTILEQVALVIIVLLGLPHFNIHIPLWGLITLMAIMLAYSYFNYRMGKKALNKRPMITSEAIVGCEGIVATPMDPKGYVKVKGELWKASSESDMEIGSEIVVTGVNGIKLIVTPKRKEDVLPPYRER